MRQSLASSMAARGDVALEVLELRLEALEEGEGVGGAPAKPGEHLAVVAAGGLAWRRPS